MMQRYRFVGSFTEMGDRTFSRFGQSADWDEKTYREIVSGPRGASFMPEADFNKIGFDQEELDRYADYANRPLAPESFNSKVKKCAVFLHELRQKLVSREVAEEISPSSELRDDQVVLESYDKPKVFDLEKPVSAAPEIK